MDSIHLCSHYALNKPLPPSGKHPPSLLFLFPQSSTKTPVGVRALIPGRLSLSVFLSLKAHSTMYFTHTSSDCAALSAPQVQSALKGQNKPESI